MSTDTEHAEEGTDMSSSVLETWEDWYHIPVIGAVMLFMFWVRAQSYGAFVTEDGTAALAGVDSWYHWRTIQWTAENYPYTMPYEIWTGFPTGNYVGQFGTLFDQIIVTVAMVVGLGDPSTSTLYLVSLLAVPAMAALVAIPVFFMGRRLGGTIGGLVAVVLLALAPGQFLARSTAGQLQHHVAEVLFMAIAVLAMMVAIRTAEREKPIYELVVDKDWQTLREPALYSALAGFALALYVWVWPPAVVLIGIFGVFFITALCIDYLRGVSPDHLAFVGATSFGITALVTILLIEEPGFSVTSFGYMQPALAILGVGGFVSMAWLAREWDNRGIDRRYYPVAVVGMIVVALGVLAVVLPDLFGRLMSEATGRIMPLDPADHRTTIQEAQQPANFTAHVFSEFGTAFYTMLAGLVFLAVRPFFGREYRAEYTLILVWSLFLISMAATQIRFAYYLVLAVAVVNAVFVADVVRLFDLDLQRSAQSLREIETYQIIVVLVVVLLLFAPLLPVVNADGNAIDRGEAASPHPDAMVWEESTHWLESNTPDPGAYGGADNASELEYYGTYDYPEGGDYDYPEGAYGVISWWDYGHLITTQGERIPHSNPFQQNARTSSAFFTAESEQQSELILEAIAADEDPLDDDNDVRSSEELEAMADEDAHEQMRYVMIDDQMAGGKFSAITAWSGPDYGHYVTPEDYQANEQIDRDEVDERFGDVPYDNTTLSQLYFDDANGMEHYRLVHENDDRSTPFISYALVDPETDQVLHGENGEPQVAINQMVDQRTQMQIAQLEQNPNVDVEVFDERQGPAVKTYERVEGATITGTVDEAAGDDATVVVDVELDPGTERGAFVYTQEAEVDEDGSFELTVPYATDDELGVEDGYTNSSVEAVSDYTVTVVGDETAFETETEVSETAVVEGDAVEIGDFEETDDEEPVDEDAADEDENGADEDADADDGADEDADDGEDADGTDEDDGEGTDETTDDENAGDDTTDSIAPVAQTVG
ncbi:oligosaccharyl transferase, archaeosortase A system-associated [Natronococcus pandeyae]|uniref:dolichyl-phosphooligosaccharide-protein glycotransferase n=1 Tax=Natronococcus pandeyae TaxID=2055836 RepID=A0A8J8TSX7_9EURY|nr:oligosaccharyl transferase, archaeosortase A system-associated [Natronococcus pandeyae]TYL39052.1 oligosaccharyl transferase, archaeosortase A system-associated [Natronococcus pandeyae]